MTRPKKCSRRRNLSSRSSGFRMPSDRSPHPRSCRRLLGPVRAPIVRRECEPARGSFTAPDARGPRGIASRRRRDEPVLETISSVGAPGSDPRELEPSPDTPSSTPATHSATTRPTTRAPIVPPPVSSASLRSRPCLCHGQRASLFLRHATRCSRRWPTTAARPRPWRSPRAAPPSASLGWPTLDCAVHRVAVAPASAPNTNAAFGRLRRRSLRIPASIRARAAASTGGRRSLLAPRRRASNGL